MRNISFALTTPQFIAGTKDVTRRMGWLFLVKDEELCGIEKGQGLGKGGKVKKLGLIRVVSVRREPLRIMITNPRYGVVECQREGFPDMSPREFVEFFCRGHKRCTSLSIVTRIEFVKIPASSLSGDERK